MTVEVIIAFNWDIVFDVVNWDIVFDVVKVSQFSLLLNKEGC